MSKELLAALRRDPAAKVRDLPGVPAWAKRFFGGDVPLDPDRPFLDQVCDLAKDCGLDASYWDPYEEGYDDGPGDLEDSWRQGGQTSNGQFRGWVVSPNKQVFDQVSASVVRAMADNNCGDNDPVNDDEVRGEFAAAINNKWESPRSQEERDAALAKEILDLASQLSGNAFKTLLEQLNDW